MSIYNAVIALKEVVGERYFSEDPAICEGYRAGPGGYESGTGYERVLTKIPVAVILPKTTEEVQKIVKICNRYDVPYVPYSTGFYGPRSHCHVDNELLIDMKRMDDFEIDAKHFFITVGPGAVFSPVQQECMNNGAYIVVGGGGAQCSVLCNILNDGWSPLSFRIGLPHRRILGLEMIMPDGDLVKMGSLAVSDDPFFGGGPGPDLRGLLRGFTGLLGCMGIVTKIAIKTLPFQPEPLIPQGVSPNSALALPTKRVRWLNFRMPGKNEQFQGMLEVGHSEIGAAITKVPLFWRVIAKAEDKEEFWKLWLQESEETIKNFHFLRVLLVGYTSEEQMVYDENVLTDIMTELGATATRTKASDESWIKNADSAGMWLMTGSYVSVDYIIETLSHARGHGDAYAELKKKYTPPLMVDFGDPGWFQNIELGHQGYSEFLIYWDQREDTDGVDQFYVDSAKMNIKNRFYPALLGPHEPLLLTGPNYGPNYHEWLLSIKNEFDPRWICHPPVPLAHDDFVQKAPWMQGIKDWETPETLPYPDHWKA